MLSVIAASPSWNEGTNIGALSAITIRQDGVFFAARSNQIYRSTARGQDWLRILTGLNDEQIRTIRIPENDVPGTEPIGIGRVGVAPIVD
jgi:hypothetical protein